MGTSKTEEARQQTREEKARQMRYRRPVCKTMRWQGIVDDLDEMRTEIDEGQWMYGRYEALNDCEGTLDEETVYELRIAFSDLSAECDRMYEDMQRLRRRESDFDLFAEDEDSEYDDPPVLFDSFFPAIDYYDEIWGYDIQEHDYYGIDGGEDYARQQARKRLKRLNKDQLIECAGMCMEIARQYMSIRARYDGLSTALAVLRGQFEASLEMVKHIEQLYKDAERATEGFRYAYGRELDRLDGALTNLPDRLWVE